MPLTKFVFETFKKHIIAQFKMDQEATFVTLMSDISVPFL